MFSQMKSLFFFYLETFNFLVVKFSIYFNRRVFVMLLEHIPFKRDVKQIIRIDPLMVVNFAPTPSQFVFLLTVLRWDFLLQFFFVCASTISCQAFMLSLSVPHLSFFLYRGRAVH